ncbi:MAG: bifunctional 2-C-methyl-D-erythritol 4-phosphate cytidylyltransferase/2-C-methyl-D-erythritol 2,4-cyclodiphosphate synthase [Erythrobacter sp.]|uniref:bifunctional 2-C-methyl-D-erythritol 4-phosphate cytidylyltransferase/2-C-methyl-D-erythritol 2,4-cyclodiphosphate synthase n=1 Tax=Erythrobacter sp. TaxID=1042 RepID=UPI003266805E
MVRTSPLPPFGALIVAAGRGERAGGTTPKQYRDFRGIPVIRHSVQTLLEAGAQPLIVVIAAGAKAHAMTALSGLEGYKLVEGGASRQASVRAGLEAMKTMDDAPERVLIHDAARPDLPRSVINRLLDALDRHPGAIPTLPVVDSLAIASSNDTMAGSAARETLRRVQTPQAFRFADIFLAHTNWDGASDAGDDAQVLCTMAKDSSGSVALVQGDERLKKITFAEDLMNASIMSPMRVGQGYDVHRLQEGEELWLGGIKIEHTHGLAGHSDADVALHAITDAVLGGISGGDIGTHFPPSDLQWKGARSGQFLEHAVKLARQKGYALGNIDLTIICEAPKIGPHRAAMRAQVGRLTGLDQNEVSIKATTTEKLGFTGRGEGIAAQAIVSLFLQETLL